MYEDRTQDVIVTEMLENFGNDVRTDENSLAYNACVKTASELEDAYGDIMDIYDNMLTLQGLRIIYYKNAVSSKKGRRA